MDSFPNEGAEIKHYHMRVKKNALIKRFIMMTLGTVLLTVGVYFFKIPNGFSTGGVSGIGTVLGKVTPVSPARWISIINFALLIVGFLFLGKETGAKTVYCSTLFSVLTWVLEDICPLSSPISSETFLELIYAMLFTSIGAAMIFNSGASSGGTDIVALILKKYTRMDVGKALLAVDFLVAGSSFPVFGVRIGLFSMLGLFMKAFLVDSVIESLNSCKYFIVITSHGEEIAQFIIKEMHHGATMCDAEGEYTHEKKQMVHTVCKRIEAIKLRAKVREIDPHSFVIISTSSDIVGRGFRAV